MWEREAQMMSTDMQVGTAGKRQDDSGIDMGVTWALIQCCIRVR